VLICQHIWHACAIISCFGVVSCLVMIKPCLRNDMCPNGITPTIAMPLALSSLCAMQPMSCFTHHHAMSMKKSFCKSAKLHYECFLKRFFEAFSMTTAMRGVTLRTYHLMLMTLYVPSSFGVHYYATPLPCSPLCISDLMDLFV